MQGQTDNKDKKVPKAARTGKYQTDNKDRQAPDRQQGQASTKQATRTGSKDRQASQTTRTRKYQRQQGEASVVALAKRYHMN
jgi:hypothetical protein